MSFYIKEEIKSKLFWWKTTLGFCLIEFCWEMLLPTGTDLRTGVHLLLGQTSQVTLRVSIRSSKRPVSVSHNRPHRALLRVLDLRKSYMLLYVNQNLKWSFLNNKLLWLLPLRAFHSECGTSDKGSPVSGIILQSH